MRYAIGPRPGPPMSSFRRSLLVVFAALLVALGMVVGVVRFVVPQGAPKAMAKPAPATTPLTRYLAFVVVDGLRHDVATDPALMPIFAQRMKDRASGEIWAGSVSMTSSAVLTYATGQRGGLDQIINNETGSKVAYDNLIDNAREKGLVTFGTGDHAWFFMFRDSWSKSKPDPSGVAIDVDFNHETFAAAYGALGDTPRPNLMVLHFVTPDHQAHAYGVQSERYKKHIHDFDQKLEKLLSAIPADTTVLITSDHGATDTGTHGSDTPVQRRSPFVAYGPGIVAKAPSDKPLDQIDLASTFAALLGVSAPAHGRGHVLVDWLDVPDAARAKIACADLDRLSSFARATMGSPEAVAELTQNACAGDAPREKIARAATAARALDDAMGTSHIGGRASAWLVPLLALLAAAALSLLAIGRQALRASPLTPAALGVGALLVIGLFLTKFVERLPGYGPTVVRVLLYVAGNAVVLTALLRARKTAEWLDRRAVLAAVIVPGILIVTPSRTTQIESFVLAAVIGLYAIAGQMPGAEAQEGAKDRAPGRLKPGPLLGAAAMLGCFSPSAFIENFGIPKLITNAPFVPAVLALAVLGAERALREVRARDLRGNDRATTAALTALGVVVASLSLYGRTHAPPTLCLYAWLGLPFLAALAWVRGRRAFAEMLAMAAYAWVSREFDMPVVVAIILLASAVAHALAERPGGVTRPFLVLLSVTFAFSLVYIVRIGVENGIDFMQLDWGAGAFRDPDASVRRIGLAIIWKHAFAVAAVVYALLSALPAELRVAVARGLVAAEALRAGFLAVVLSSCGDSFWTALRVIGDLPHPLVAMVVASVALVVVTRRAREPSPKAEGEAVAIAA